MNFATTTTAQVLERLMDHVGMDEAEREPWREEMGAARICEALQLVEDLGEPCECSTG